jgi:hypothetical protein
MVSPYKCEPDLASIEVFISRVDDVSALAALSLFTSRSASLCTNNTDYKLDIYFLQKSGSVQYLE